MTYRFAAFAAAAAVLTLQGCATPPAPVVQGEDLNFGIAKTCSFTPVQLTPGGTASSTVTMSNDGWCAVRVKEPDGQPYQLGLLRARPEHGRILIQKLGGETRLEYTADPGWVGTDRYTAELRPREGNIQDSTIQIVVEVSRGEGVAPPPAAEPEKPATTTTRRPARSTTRRTTTP